MFYIGGINDDLRTEIHNALTERGLTSHMNDTKWYKLCTAIYEEMPFPPSYWHKDVLYDAEEPEDPQSVGSSYGDWARTPEASLGLHIEWLKVDPRYAHHRGQLIPPRIEDCSAQFRDILIRLNIPFTEEEHLFVIHGHSVGVELPRHVKTPA
ncbi:DUF6678 family protein [Agrobacterium sp. Azo12]|jgi:hypothetical protein|uniref:DUF6678 family protein n=1 Tax=Agrobacterium sp. Azo12 TaxID=3031129 RepID=UPI0023D82798|nr:DUF6678 family protein [Agrobacterium sp. Azo12]MDO5895810.1 hypothetical protein [Agrobacterium sp. Azo12]